MPSGTFNMMGDAKCLAGLRVRVANCMGEIGEVVGI